MKKLPGSKNIRCFLLIFFCFLWTSCGYLSWLYRLSDFISGHEVDLASEVVGYLFQAVGLFLFSFIIRRKPEAFRRGFFFFAVIVDFLLIFPAVLSKSLAAVFIFGYGMNLFHGVVAGCYLGRLSIDVSPMRRGTVLGFGYGLASIASWLLSQIGSDNFLRSKAVFFVYAFLLLITAGFIFAEKEECEEESLSLTDEGHPLSLLLLAGGTVFLLSLVKNLGFAFPFADLEEGISLIFSRVFYAVGLIAAGLIADKDRRYAAICCIASLGVPFLMTAVSGEIGPSYLIWILNYILFGFFTVFRVLLFSDLSRRNPKLLYLSGWGLSFGRLGDAAGTYGCILFAGTRWGLFITEALLFAVTILVFFVLYQKLYLPLPPAKEQKPDSDQFVAFSKRFALTARETEILRFMLTEKNNSDMAQALYVSESTVKFHIHNLLKKTGCDNRRALMSLYEKEMAKEPD